MCFARMLQLHIDFTLPNYAVHNLLFHQEKKNIRLTQTHTEQNKL